MLIGVSADGTRTPALFVAAVAVKPSTGDTPTLTIKQRMRHKVPGAKKPRHKPLPPRTDARAMTKCSGAARYCFG